jgi:hypothetical protein
MLQYVKNAKATVASAIIPVPKAVLDETLFVKKYININTIATNMPTFKNSPTFRSLLVNRSMSPLYHSIKTDYI